MGTGTANLPLRIGGNATVAAVGVNKQKEWSDLIYEGF
jgi:hypothetical protein